MFTPRSSTASDSASPAVESRRATAGRLREPTLWLARATPHSLYGLLDCGRRERPGSAAIVFLILVELGSRVPPAGQAGPRDHVMRGALGGPRVLLRRLREVMAEPVSAQERLDKIVVLIAANMVAEVCSVYVLRVDGTLELYATEGLKKEAVHQTVLRQDEGLVGLVASEANPINLSQAQDHPAFSYRPETGEENYHSFLGVPVLRAGNTLGVLVVQNRARRTYSEEEEEALQTTARVLAEMICSSAARSRTAASTAMCSRPTACSPMTAAGCIGSRKRCAPASPPKPQSSACSPTPAPACCARPIPICASACTISTNCRTG